MAEQLSGATMLLEIMTCLWIGNSITRGQGIRVPDRFATLVGIEQPCESVNLGEGGTSAGDWASRSFDAYTDVRDIRIELGASDANREIDPAQYALDLASLVDLFHPAATVWIATSPRADGRADRGCCGWNHWLVQYRLEVLALCQPVGDRIRCGPDLWNEPISFPPDNPHPDTAGHRTIADAWLRVVIPEPDSRAAQWTVLALLGAIVALWGMKR